MDDLDVVIPVHIRQKVRALEYDLTTDIIYWIDENDAQASILKSFANGSNEEEVEHSESKEVLSTPSDIALDPYGKQLYWTDRSAKNIKVTSLVTGFTGVVVDEEDGNTPKSIALDPKRGYAK